MMNDQIRNFTVIENLKRELFANISIFMMRVNETVILRTETATKAKSHYKGKFDGISNIPYDDLIQLILFFMPSYGKSWQLSTEFIMEALKSGELVVVEPNNNTCSFSPVYYALIKLLEEIKRFKNGSELTEERENEFRRKYVNAIRAKESIISIENPDLLHTFANYNTQTNIINLTMAILMALEGNPSALDNVKLLPPSPIEEEKNQMAKEEVSEKEIRDYFGIGNR